MPFASFRQLATGLATLGLPVLSLADAAQPLDQAEPASPTPKWETTAHGVTLSMTQLLPDQVRAFYLNRGFSAEAADSFARACVYMTVLRNDAASGELSYRLADWQLLHEGKPRRIPALEHWLTLWQQRGASAPAQIAFRWAQFPPEQDYALGEWNQGMLATGLPADATFQITAQWQVLGKSYRMTLENVRCPR
jgi:hypothetical protein